MGEYYYFPATLPTLLQSMANPPLSYKDFMDRAKDFLSPKDMALLNAAKLYSSDDSVVPDCTKKSTLLKKYFSWEKALKNELVRLRAGKLQKSADKYIRPGEMDTYAARSANTAFMAEDPLQGEMLLESERWALIESLAGTHTFDTEFIIAYSLQLQILERKACFNVEKGQKSYRTVYQSVLDNADYRDESGETK